MSATRSRRFWQCLADFNLMLVGFLGCLTLWCLSRGNVAFAALDVVFTFISGWMAWDIRRRQEEQGWVIVASLLTAYTEQVRSEAMAEAGTKPQPVADESGWLYGVVDFASPGLAGYATGAAPGGDPEADCDPVESGEKP